MRIPAQIASLLATSAVALALATPAHAEFQLQAYGGANSNLDSKVKTRQGAVNDSRTISWDGKSLSMPPYWGVRGTYWFDRQSPWGIALDYTHAKAYADLNFATDPTYSHLEFTDGINIYTVNAMYRFQNKTSPWGFYVGGGPGISVPSVEVSLKAAPTQTTKEYQLGGFAAQVLAGAEYKFTDKWSAFGEGKFSYTKIDGDLPNNGSVKTELWSPQVAVGVAYRF
jgi:lipid A oxidase